MLPLLCPTQAYDWGSTHAIPGFQRRRPDGAPVAEVWLGTHPLGTARFVDRQGEERPLTEVAGELDFMLKLLAAERPLSIQVHPNSARAQAGYAAEEERGVPLAAPERVFKDPRPKPEMVVALSTFDTLVGFRPTAEILRVLMPLPHPVARALTKKLRDNPGFAGIVRLVEGLLLDPPSPEDVAAIVDQCRAALDDGIDIKRAYATAVEIEKFHPGDVGVLVSLLLNRLTLQPGEAAYLDTGIIHAHLSGMCLEVMIASDNVLRAGLTTKHVDPDGLVLCLEEGMSRVARVSPQLFGTSTDIFSPNREFALSVTQSSQADPAGVILPASGPRLLVCTGGEVALLNERDEMLHLRRGDAAYADDNDGELRIVGTGEVAQAYAPDGAAGRLDDLL
ncbi:mannose-6-phosphate isomerase, class I [Pimelobacter simplex]|uniref:mannose-6-phosphate isomerase n=1 Tax=Nocardioides simplex TaxID=2045 RepID=A0A0C5XMK8_NOCSI|nr:mannose-6-phosphate isomerase, class I [Pimelobacter simplex]AJR18697.1 Mannose-6-phosphate isomerase [Pimelobacter simplex]KAB2812192.1 mannose-6-phosphate isomerase, class I [Pimelobacter simplex]MCG8152467.1 mannose-6-phosphate isomerase, class I [Pimelobacter simplex]SFM28037.1 mannose-6-phosphate isomerase, type 1 [Pimelobacter simplex]GEB14578.1 mannose-6-phosphate isomerase [Pimelobacter simplex]